MSELEEAMRSDDPEERRRATSALPSAPDGERGALLIRALGDVDWRVRKEGARVAASVAEDWGLLPELVDGLCQGENVGLRNSALEVLERLGPRAANALLVALPRVPEPARKFVVAALGFAGGAGVEKLAELSRDAEPNTAQAAIEALARVGGDRAEEALRGHLEAEDPVQRLAALEGLERLQAQVSLDALAPLLGDRLVRRLALRILGYSEEPGAAATLLGALEDGGAASLEATVALGRLLTRGGPAAREMAKLAEGLSEPVRKHLRTVAQSGRDEARRAATWVLLLARDEQSLGAAAELAADDRLPPVALDVIRRWGGSAIRPLVDASSELSPRGRAIALQMASDLAARAEPAPDVLRSLRAALRALLSSDEATVVAAGAEALGRWAEPEDAKLLLRAARAFPEQVARAAGRALERLASSAPDAVEAELSSVPLDGQLGAALLPAVAALGGQSATDLLQATLNADDPRARRAAVMALPRLGGERAVELAGFALADEDVDVQVAAVTVLAQLSKSGGDLGVAPLRLALRASFEPVIAAAARALGQIRDRASIATMRELVSEGRPGVAVAAMEALRVMEDPALDDLLVEALGQEDEELVKEALRAIAQSEAPRREARIALALEHSAWDVRQLAASLLGQLGTDEARASLTKRRGREGDKGVRESIDSALDEPLEPGEDAEEGD